jgi:hypothetical protein
MNIFLIHNKLLRLFEIVKVTQFLLKEIFKYYTCLFRPILLNSLLDDYIFIFIFINTFDINRQTCEERRSIFLFLYLCLSINLVERLKFFRINVYDSCCKRVHFVLLNIIIDLVIIINHIVLLLFLQKLRIYVMHITLFIR